MNRFSALPRLGVGINYQPEFIPLLRAHEDAIDFIEISPDILCHESWDGVQCHTGLHPLRLKTAMEWGRIFPVIAHGLGLSIGSASGWNQDYLHTLQQFHQVQPFHWHSEHLGFMQVTDERGVNRHAGVQLPVPFTEEALDLICPRIDLMCRRFGTPFLLENTTYYLPDMPCDNGMDEIDFLNQIQERTSCGLLLDLYNLHCNAVNFGFDAIAALNRLNLEGVVEIHLAGGASHESLLLDVHSDLVPEPVWDMLDWTLERAPNVCAVVYELLEQALDIVGERGILQQLNRARDCWSQHHKSVGEEDRYAIA